MSKQTNKPDCYKCIYRKKVPGDAHSSCEHPSIGELSPITKLMGLLKQPNQDSSIQKAADELNIVANYQGIKRGWFNWPMNFDPIWLENCDGFVSEDE